MMDLLFPSLLLLLGGVHALRRIRRLDTIHLIDVTIWMTCAFFGTGPWLAWAFSLHGQLPQHPGIVVAKAYIAIFLFVFALMGTATILTSGANRRAAAQGVLPAHSLRLMLLQGEGASVWVITGAFILAVALKFYVGLKYGFFMLGESATRDVDISYTVTSLFALSMIVWRASFACALLGLFHRPRRHVVLGSIIVLCTFLFDFTMGRRPLIIDTFLLFACWLLLRGMNLRFFLGVVCIIAVLGYFAMPFFWSIRYYRYRGATQTRSVAGFVRAVGDAITDWDKAAREAGYAQNMATRPLTVQLNIAVAEGLEHNSPTYGYCLYSSAVMCIPYALYPDKRLVPPSEQILVAQLGTPNVDMGDNWPAYAAAEFGTFVGPLLFGLFVGLLLYMLQRLALAIGWRMPYLGMCLLAVGYDLAVSVETTPQTAFGTIRHVLLVITPFLVCFPFVRPKLSSSLAPPAAAELPEEFDADSHAVVPSASLAWSTGDGGDRPL